MESQCDSCIHSTPSFNLLWCSKRLTLVTSTYTCDKWYLRQPESDAKPEEDDDDPFS